MTPDGPFRREQRSQAAHAKEVNLAQVHHHRWFGLLFEQQVNGLPHVVDSREIDLTTHGYEEIPLLRLDLNLE
jgi:hypothetical protein